VPGDGSPVTGDRPYRVLLVDDDPVALLTWDRVLRRAGMAVTTAAGSEEALSLVATGDFDVVVTDIQMPGLSGLELLDRLLRGIPDLPVVVVTSAVGVDSTLDVRRCGAAGFLRKPLDHADLVRTVTLLAQIRCTPQARSSGVDAGPTSLAPVADPSVEAWSERAPDRADDAPRPLRDRSAAPRHPAGLHLQLRLEQGQRLEGLSQLAGGVAHDINNLLSEIVSHLDLVQDEVGAEHAETGAARWEPVQADIAHIRATLDRAAGLAQHLLTFARREPAAAASEPVSPGNSASPLAGPSPTGGPERPGATVLVVDDEPGLREVTSRLLVRAGYRVLTAGSGQDALAVAARHPAPVDLLLTDMNMPAMAGSEVASRFRALHPGAGVVVMSGYAEHADDRTAGRGELVLGKPFTRAALLDAVAGALPTH